MQLPHNASSVLLSPQDVLETLRTKAFVSHDKTGQTENDFKNNIE